MILRASNPELFSGVGPDASVRGVAITGKPLIGVFSVAAKICLKSVLEGIGRRKANASLSSSSVFCHVAFSQPAVVS